MTVPASDNMSQLTAPKFVSNELKWTNLGYEPVTKISTIRFSLMIKDISQWICIKSVIY